MDAASSAKRKRILIVEDEPGYQELLESILGAGPFKLTVCSSAEAALPKIDTMLFDLILVDINLQGMTGMQVLDKVKALGRLEACPVVICSSQIDPVTKATSARLGAAGFIPKPFQPEMVRSLVRTLLDVTF